MNPCPRGHKDCQCTTISDVARIVTAARRRRDSLTPKAAAREAWHPGGPSLEVLEARLARMRAWYEEKGAA